MSRIFQSALAVGVTAIVLCASACSAAKTESGNVSADSTSDTASSILTDNPAPAYTAVKFAEMGGAGEPQSYEELQDYIKPYGSVNFLAFEITGSYSAEDAVKLTNDDIYNDSAMLYDIHVTYDYMGETPLDITAKLSSAGTPEQQFEGMPPYAVGSSYAGFLPDFDADGLNYENSCLLFALESGSAYQIFYDNLEFIDENGNNIADADFTPQSVITTTANNPVQYTNRIPVDALADFLKADWSARGYTIQTVKNA